MKDATISPSHDLYLTVRRMASLGAQDPLNCMNNVGRSSYCIGQVQRAFFEALTTLKAAMVRVNQDGKEVSSIIAASHLYFIPCFFNSIMIQVHTGGRVSDDVCRSARFERR